MMKFVFAAMLLAAPAIAEVAKVENCAPRPEMPTFLRCDVTNTGTVTIAVIRYTVEVSQPDRAVPWITADVERPMNRPVEGGIEPGERIKLSFLSDWVSDRADPEKTIYKVIAIQSLDPTGAPIAP